MVHKLIFIALFSFAFNNWALTTPPEVKFSSSVTNSIDYPLPARCSGTLGEKIACQLTQDYNNTTKGCGKYKQSAAFLCSGLVLRGTSANLNRTFHSWNPSPLSQKSGGVSFSYLRRDSKFSRLAYGYVSGFIFYPVLFSHGQDSNIEILCGYPLDAATDHRNDKGCGPANDSSVGMGGQCNLYNINTGKEWVENVYNKSHNRLDYCSFSLLDVQNNREQFQIMLDAMKELGHISFSEQNELRLETWGQDKKDVPIEAFFYIDGNDNGLKSAQKDQSDFQLFAGRAVPVIRLKLPSSQSDDATFNFNIQDQIITGL